MLEKISKVSNPLTIVAIFATFAEIASTVALPLVDKGLQGLFVWFVMSFPAFLLLLFFATLNFNSRVLYAPSDFRSDEGFIEINKQFEKMTGARHLINSGIQSPQRTQSIEVQRAIVSKFNEPYCRFFLAIANRTLSLPEHADCFETVVGDGKKSGTKNDMSSLLETMLLRGHIYGIYQTLNGLIVKVARKGDINIEVTISKEVLELLERRIDDLKSKTGKAG